MNFKVGTRSIARSVWVGLLLIFSSSGCGSVSNESAVGTTTASKVTDALEFLIEPQGSVVDASISPAVRVRALDSSGNLNTTFGGTITVSLASNPGSATLSGRRSATAVNGIATFSNLAISAPGSGYTLRASGGEASAVISQSFDVQDRTPVRLVFLTQPSNSTGGVSLGTIRVQAVDEDGVVVKSYADPIVITIAEDPSAGATLSGTATLSPTNGEASFTGLKIDNAGVGYTLEASSGSLIPATSNAFNISVGPATALTFSSEPTNALVDAAIDPAIEVTAVDAGGNAVTSFTGSVVISISTNPGSATLSGTTTQSASAGTATFSDLQLNQPGSAYTLRATSGTFSAAFSAAFDIEPRTATQLVFITPPADATSGSSLGSVKLRALDADGVWVRTFQDSVSIAVANDPSSGATLNGTTTLSTTNGEATFSDLSLDKAGTGYTLEATSATLSPVTSDPFDISVGPATALQFTIEPSNALVDAVIDPAVEVTAVDSGGNPVTSYTGSVTITISTNPGSATLSGTSTLSASGGVATFSDLQLDQPGTAYTLRATSGSLSAAFSAAFDIGARTATQLAFVTEPSNANSGASLGNVKIRALDADGIWVRSFQDSITLAIETDPSSGATLSGTLSAAASNGEVVASDLSIDKVGTGYTLVATSGSLTSASSASFNITPGAASTLVFTTQPSNAASGGTISPSIEVTVLDAQGNVVTDHSSAIVMSLSTNPGSATLSGTLSVTPVNGVATLSDLSLDQTGTGYRLTAQSGSLSVVSDPFDIESGTAAGLVFMIQPANTMAGTAFSQAISVQVIDGNGNPVTSYTDPVTLSIDTNPSAGTLSGTTTVTPSSGIASFPGLSIDLEGTGYTLSAASGTFSAVSDSFNITPLESADRLAIVSFSSPVTAGSTLGDVSGVRVEARTPSGAVDPAFSGTITIAIGTNAGSPAGTLSGTLTATATSGVATFSDLSIHRSGAGYTLTASTTGLTSATSSPFTISAGAVSGLEMTQAPGNGRPASSLNTVSVRAVDSLGNTVTNYSTAISLSLSTNPGSATLTGGGATTPSSGVATFPSVSLDKSGNGYVITASSGSYSVASSPFHVGIDLEVPVELLDSGISSGTSATTFDRTRTSFLASHYQDATYPSLTTFAWEAVCMNTGGSNQTILLVTDGGTTAGSLTLPASTSVPTRITGSFSPSASAVNYRVSFPGTAAHQIQCFSARILVRQTYAYKTRIAIPMTGRAYDLYDNVNATSSNLSLVNTSSTTSTQGTLTSTFGIFRKQSTDFSGTIANWTLEGVMSTAGGGTNAHLILQNRDAALEVSAAEVVFNGTTTMTRASVNFSDSATNFTNNQNFELRVRRSGGNSEIRLWKTLLWIEISANLQKASVPYRIGRSALTTTSSLIIPHQRASIDLSRFLNPTVRYEVTGWETSSNTSTFSLLNHQTGDSGTAGTQPITGSTLDPSGIGTKGRLTSSSLSLTSGDRYLSGVGTSLQQSQALLWITSQ